MYKELILSQVRIESQKLKYEYRLDRRLFSKTFVFKNFHELDLHQEIYSNAVNYLGIIAALPYFRLLPRKFVSEVISLDDYDINFFRELFLNGLG